MTQRNLKRVMQTLSATSLLLMLSACSTPGSNTNMSQAPAHPWESYRCTAIGESYHGTGWATNEPTARASAMAKCQGNTTAAGSCHVTDCHKEAPPQQNAGA